MIKYINSLIMDTYWMEEMQCFFRREIDVLWNLGNIKKTKMFGYDYIKIPYRLNNNWNVRQVAVEIAISPASVFLSQIIPWFPFKYLVLPCIIHVLKIWPHFNIESFV